MLDDDDIICLDNIYVRFQFQYVHHFSVYALYRILKILTIHCVFFGSQKGMWVHSCSIKVK